MENDVTEYMGKGGACWSHTLLTNVGALHRQKLDSLILLIFYSEKLNGG
jgi:hypothetical protein